MRARQKYVFGIIFIVTLVHTKAQLNATNSPAPPVFTLPANCRDAQGNTRQIGESWKPSVFSTCTCTGPQSIQCFAQLPPPVVKICTDGQLNIKKPGEVWLEDPRTNCTCTRNNFVLCEILREPVCLDVSGKFRTNLETWSNGSCVECACVNGSINCNRYDVNISYGLYSVILFHLCEQCIVPSQTALALSACKAFFDNRAYLSECGRKGSYIRESHRCNGISECPDGSDEKGCENVKCQDEEGSTFLMKSQYGSSSQTKEHGWEVSKCLRCHCNGGLLTCQRTLTINFPGYFEYFYKYEENCTQPSCKVLKFVNENKQWCEASELMKDRGIIFEGQTWKEGGCSFYFPGSTSSRSCAIMTRPICYVYNGYICCASQCPGLQQIAEQIRGNLSICPNGRQLESESLKCRDANNCLRNANIQNCSSEVTCQDEDSNQYFEGATWSVGECMKCSCLRGTIRCSRKVVYVSFLKLTPKNKPASNLNFNVDCSQPKCNVAEYMKINKDICNACRWNGHLYYEGDHWKENGVDFYCSRPDQRVRPGCYIESTSVTCTGAIPGIRELSKISRDELFLCDSGDEIRSLSDRCNIQPTCADKSDERNCGNYYCAYELAHGFLWNRTQVDRQVLKQCSLVNSTWTGTFGSNCTKGFFRTLWKHNTSCYCENKALLEHFKSKIAGVNISNFMNVSEELASSGQAKEFTNPIVFHDLFKELFHIATSRFLAPITHQNADTALHYCKHVMNTVHGSPVYGVHIFCKAKLAYDRNLLAYKALEFLKQAPNGTEAYNVGSKLQINYVEDVRERLPHVTPNFRPNPYPTFVIQRKELVLQLNVAPLIPAVVEKPTVKVNAIDTNVTRKNNNTKVNETKIMNKNVTNELTDKQIKDLLRENNCTRVTLDEETGVFKYNAATSKEDLKHAKFQSDMELILLCISIAAIILALTLLTVLRLKNSERLFIHKSLLISLGVANLVFVLDKTSFGTRQEHTVLCSAVAVVQHYFETAVFTWMLVEGINLYIKLVKVFSVKKQYIVYVAIGWGIPAIIVGLVAAIRPSTFDMSQPLTTDITCGALKLTAEIVRTRCWLTGSLWIYKGPILVILVINFVLFAILLRVIFGKIASKYGNSHVSVAKRGLRSVIALLPLLGVTWLVGFFLEFHNAIVYVFILLSSTQGVIFCIFHCFLDDQVQDALRRLRVKERSTSKTRETPASNPNTTPVLERNSRVNMLLNSVDESTTKDVVELKETQQDDTSL